MGRTARYSCEGLRRENALTALGLEGAPRSEGVAVGLQRIAPLATVTWARLSIVFLITLVAGRGGPAACTPATVAVEGRYESFTLTSDRFPKLWRG